MLEHKRTQLFSFRFIFLKKLFSDDLAGGSLKLYVHKHEFFYPLYQGFFNMK